MYVYVYNKVSSTNWNHKAKKGTAATSKKNFSLPRWINVPQEEDVSASIEDGVSEIPRPCANPAWFF